MADPELTAAVEAIRESNSAVVNSLQSIAGSLGSAITSLTSVVTSLQSITRVAGTFSDPFQSATTLQVETMRDMPGKIAGAIAGVWSEKMGDLVTELTGVLTRRVTAGELRVQRAALAGAQGEVERYAAAGVPVTEEEMATMFSAYERMQRRMAHAARRMARVAEEHNTMWENMGKDLAALMGTESRRGTRGM